MTEPPSDAGTDHDTAAEASPLAADTPVSDRMDPHSAFKSPHKRVRPAQYECAGLTVIRSINPPRGFRHGSVGSTPTYPGHPFERRVTDQEPIQ